MGIEGLLEKQTIFTGFRAVKLAVSMVHPSLNLDCLAGEQGVSRLGSGCASGSLAVGGAARQREGSRSACVL